jgi:hypothetical protein
MLREIEKRMDAADRACIQAFDTYLAAIGRLSDEAIGVLRRRYQAAALAWTRAHADLMMIIHGVNRHAD